MIFGKKRSKKERKRSVLIIEEMVTDNNGLPVLNFGDDVLAAKEAQIQQILNPKKINKKLGPIYTKHIFDDNK